MSSLSPEDKDSLIATLKFLHEQDEALETHTVESLRMELAMLDNADEVIFGLTMVASALLKLVSASFNVPVNVFFQHMYDLQKEEEED